MLHIVADQDIVALESAFADIGELSTRPGRTLERADLQNADVLLVRSITPVTEALLADTPVRLVATATSGTDHIDLDYLHRAGIALIDAHGSNADAVVEYCLTALSLFAREEGEPFFRRSCAVIGAGAVGSRLVQRLLHLGFTDVRYCDPLLDRVAADPLQAAGASRCELPVAIQADIVSLHVPLTTEGQSATWHLLNAQQLVALAPNAVVINTARGPVVDSLALLDVLRSRPDLRVVLDVWEHEPTPLPELVSAVTLATPHIAGYSQQAKRAATFAVADGIRRWAGLAPSASSTPNLGSKRLEPPVEIEREDPLWSRVLTQVLDLPELSQAFKSNPHHDAASFDRFRRELVNRPGFAQCEVRCPAADGLGAARLLALGLNPIQE